MSMSRHVAALCALGIVGLTAWKLERAPEWPKQFAPVPVEPLVCAEAPIFETVTVRNAAPHYAHASSAIALAGGGLRAFWYEGSRELFPDVRIYTSIYAGGSWSPPTSVIGPKETADAVGRFVLSVGNAIPLRAPDGQLALIYSSVGIGGWSGTNLNVMRSPDEGATWLAPRRIRTVPTFEFSSNVRGVAVPTSDRSLLVPVYNEFIRHHPEVYLFDANLEPRGRARLGLDRRMIQPFVIPTGEHTARAFMRSGRASVTLTSVSEDAGRNWSPATETTIAQRDKPVAIVPLGQRRWLMASSSVTTGGELGAATLSLSEDDGANWRTFHALPGINGAKSPSAYYPWLLRGSDGLFDLLVTYRDESSDATGSRILHYRFNAAWLRQQGGSVCP